MKIVRFLRDLFRWVTIFRAVRYSVRVRKIKEKAEIKLNWSPDQKEENNENSQDGQFPSN